MAQNTSSDSSSPSEICEDLVAELIGALDEAAQLDDLVKSLKVRRCVIDALLILILE